MRLSLCLLLIVLDVYCCEANVPSIVCNDLVKESTMYIMKSEEEVKKELKKYNAPPEAIEAKLEVKRCVDQMSYEDGYIVAKIVVDNVFQCEWQHGSRRIFHDSLFCEYKK